MRIHLLFLAALCLPLHAQSTILYWDGDGSGPVDGGTGTWNTTLGSWSTDATTSTVTVWDNTAPTDHAVFLNTAGTVTLGTNITVQSLTFGTTGYTLSGPNTLTFDGGSGSIDTGSGNQVIEVTLAGDDGLTKSGTGSLSHPSARIFVGKLNGDDGTLEIAIGGSVSSVFSYLGHDSGSNGTADISGTWTNTNNLSIGNQATGSLTVLDGGLVNVKSGIGTTSLASGADSAGTLNITGSTAAGILNTATVNGGAGTAILNFNHTDADYRFSTDGAATGTGVAITATTSVNHLGSGTTTLAGANNYSGGTTVEAGKLTLANNNALGLGQVTVNGGTLHINEGISPTNAITLAGGSVEMDFSAGAGLTNALNVTSQFTGGAADTTASILSGNASVAATLTGAFAATSGADNDALRLGDVFSLSGSPVIDVLTGKTDLFVLQFEVTDVDADSLLAWLDPNTNTWINAVNGNFGGTSEFQGDAAYDPGNDFVLGYYGVDTTTKSVWAVINHNSEFSVVGIPEPSAFAMLGVALGGLLLLRRRA
jgi:T5SS/PEP-CTERM-associated repeat protein/autotransporter-associated beta strand protein